MGLGFCLVFRRAFAFRRVTQSDGWEWPRHLVIATILVACYFGALFIGMGAYYGEGGAELRDGAYVWLVGGTVVRPITARQYASFEANLAMVFSAGWISSRPSRRCCNDAATFAERSRGSLSSYGLTNAEAVKGAIDRLRFAANLI